MDKIEHTDKIQRDYAHNAKLNDIYQRADGAKWVQFGPGIQMRLLRTSAETGHWSAVFKCDPGSSFARHEHLGAGEYYVLSGKVVVRGGIANGGNISYEGDYGYEPNGVIHDSTEFPEGAVVYFSNDGPLRFIDDDNNTLFVCDWRMLRDVAAAAG